MTRRLAEVLRGLLALVLLVGLVGGVPWSLVRFVGWPLPTAVPSLDGIAGALTSSGSVDGVVLKVVAVVVWVAWLQLAWSVAAEVVTLVARRPRAAPQGTVRRVAATLVTTAALLVGTFGGARPLPMPALASALAAPFRTAPASAAEPGAAGTLAPPAAASTGGVASPPVAPGAPADLVVRVRRGDCLSVLAEQHYGDQAEWVRIWEANRGRSFGTRVFDDPNLILVGWELRLPGVAPASAPGLGRSLPLAAAPIVERPLPASGLLVAAEPAGATSGELVPAVVPADPSPAVAPAPGATLPVGTPGGVARPEVALPAVADPSAVPGVAPEVAGLDRPAPPAWVQPAGLSGAVLLASGVAGLVASRRRRRLRGAGRDEVLAPLAESLAFVERATKGSADVMALARLDVALRALASSLAPASLARPLAVLLHPDGTVEVVLVEAAGAPPTPWRATTPVRWVLDPTVSLGELAALAREAIPCPALVMIGTTEDGAALHLDLEAAGLVVLDGEPIVVHALARAVLATLAVSPLSHLVRVVLTGLEPSGLYDAARVDIVDDADAVLEAVAATSAAVRGALGRGGPASTFALRSSTDNGEAWEPAVGLVLGVGSPAWGAHAAELAGRGGTGVALVTDARLDAPCRLRVEHGLLVVEPLGIRVTPLGLAANELASLAALIEAVDGVPHPAPRPAAVTAPFVESPWSLLVRVLGPVDVVDPDGGTVGFDRSKALELVAWLALHREQPRRSSARGALWETEVRDATLANVVSDARRSLAKAVTPPTGEEWIARSTADRLPLHPQVVTDAELLRARLDHACGAGDAEAVEVLRPGVALLRDQPFAGSAYLWPDGEAVPTSLIVLATSAAAELAVRCLALGDVDGAFWATSQGLKALPGHEGLVCLRMQAHAQRGDLAGVRSEYQTYERVVLADPWGDGTPAGKVVALRNRLLRPSS